MTEQTIAEVLGKVLNDEGGISNDPDDHGGFTNWGLTADFLETVTGESWTAQKIANLTRDQALGAYRKWLSQTKLDQLPDVAGFAHAVIDWAVNSGEARAIRALQKALGTAVDGVIGPQTLGALAQCSPLYLDGLRLKMIASRLRFLGADISADKSQARFASSWLNRIADQLQDW